MCKLVAPFLAMLAILVCTCSMTVLQVPNDPKGHITLGDAWFEDFKSKISILRWLDCHNSPRRATGCLGEQNGSSGGLLASQLAMASNHSPRRVSVLA